MILTKVDLLTPGWLTLRLKEHDALRQGSVAAFSVDTDAYNKGYVSDIAILRLIYSLDAQGTLPPSLFLKLSKSDLHPEIRQRGCHEVEFYQAVNPFAPPLPVPTCYDAACDAANNQYHILLADLSATHFQKPLPLPPSTHHCEMIVESLAELHAVWWNSPRLGTGLGHALDETAAAESRARLDATFPKFVDYLGDALLPSQRAALEQILASSFLERLGRRLIARENVTLIHGDAHTGNLMLPKDDAHDRVILIDWQLWDINVAAIDLAFLMALHWSPLRRAALEKPLLERYYVKLSAAGVTNYSFADFWNDYRESVIIMGLIPIGQFRRGSPAGVVWFGLQDSLAAFEDLHCRELLS